jgi:hypothetical protein
VGTLSAGAPPLVPLSAANQATARPQNDAQDAGEMNECRRSGHAAARNDTAANDIATAQPIRTSGRFEGAAVADRSNGHHTER